MKEIIQALNEQRILECFGAGTAAIVSPVKMIGYQNRNYQIPLDPNNPEEQAGPLAKRLFHYITDIQYGKIKHPWIIIVPEKKIDSKHNSKKSI